MQDFPEYDKVISYTDGNYFTEEHIIPKSVGGLIKTFRVCKKCNDTLGRNVDLLLANSTLLAPARILLGIKGNSGKMPKLP